VYSVVVPTYNRARTLALALESLLVQDLDSPYEIIVVNNNSSDDTMDVIHSFERRAPGRLRFLFESMQGVSAARNAGIGAAHGEIIAFTEDDATAHPTWLRALATTYREHPDAWAVGGRIIQKLPGGYPSWFDPISPRVDMAGLLGCLDYGENTIKLEYPDAAWTGNLSVRKDVLARIGLFNTHLGRVGSQLLCGEDFDLCVRIHRAGGALYYNGQALVIHQVPSSRLTKRYFRERAYWQGRSDGFLFTQGEPIFERDLVHEATITAKDCVKMLLFYSFGNDQRGFECELAARKRLGYLQETVVRPWGESRAKGRDKLKARSVDVGR